MKKKYSSAKKRNHASLQVEQFEARLLPTADLTMVSVGAPTAPPSPIGPVRILPRAGAVHPPAQVLAAPLLVGVAGEQVTIQQTVRNLGNTPTVFSFKDKLFLSADAVLDGKDLVLGET